MFEKKDKEPDAILEVLKTLTNTIYPVGQKLEAYYTDTKRLSLGIFEGKKSPLTWRFLDQGEIDKLLLEKYIKRVG